MMTFVLYQVFFIISGQILKLLGSNKGGAISLIIIGLLTIWVVFFLKRAIRAETDATALKDTVDSVKEFVIAIALIGRVIGGALAGFISKSLGRKNGLIIAVISFFVSAIFMWKMVPETKGKSLEQMEK